VITRAITSHEVNRPKFMIITLSDSFNWYGEDRRLPG